MIGENSGSKQNIYKENQGADCIYGIDSYFWGFDRVLAAVTIGGNLMGIVGMLVFIPLLSVFYTIFREYVYLRLKKQRIKRVTTTEIEKYTEDKK